jgi:hypothetical protein
VHQARGEAVVVAAAAEVEIAAETAAAAATAAETADSTAYPHAHLPKGHCPRVKIRGFIRFE